ncbi:hypothetical protein D3C84_1030180 [compost metagenome]
MRPLSSFLSVGIRPGLRMDMLGKPSAKPHTVTGSLVDWWCEQHTIELLLENIGLRLIQRRKGGRVLASVAADVTRERGVLFVKSPFKATLVPEPLVDCDRLDSCLPDCLKK